ncbi:histidine triad (HIT) family protein [Desulfosarcina sp. BuS5]|uniref:histidine triad nucleotide-binding protein n=1 Tax=Desulfosarcina sp. BuS5 TaxID=933262 RepID=UPI002378930B|nr:histidine triad nucleotide-binding protein [Desulfosarcina sp. BuS5]WDN89250.1 histidine triad (HIT) family protein [Desulfosarcina sp. BuS5]
MENDCLFCKIINKEIPSDFIYENDRVVVFRDINPQAPLHLLIVPKKHIRSINDITGEDLGFISEMIIIARDMAKKELVAESGYKLFFNVEKGGGQIIFHIHLHLIGGWKQD